jgi:hypothetical protein
MEDAVRLRLHLSLLQFAQVLAFEPAPHKGIPKPSYQRIARRKRQPAEGD